MSTIPTAEEIRIREEEERTKSVQAMVAKQSNKECVKSSEYHMSDRVKSVAGTVSSTAKEKYHEHKANKEHQKLVDHCTSTGEPLDDGPPQDQF